MSNIKKFTCFISIGLGTKGYHACPLCGDMLHSKRSKHLNKNIYLGYRRWLPLDHEMREKLMRAFDGRIETRSCPNRMTPLDWYEKWIQKDSTNVASHEDDEGSYARTLHLKGELPIWYSLPYWKDLKINHLLDPMHIFKNVAASLWRHLMGLKDSEATRKDLKESNSKPTLWPQTKGGKVTYRVAPWVLSKDELKIINERIQGIRTPVGYGASMRVMHS